jgi:TetR/AcrR family transcriptional regulator, transcriptional repressor for nem operon
MAEDTKGRLVMTALNLFAEKGYESTSVSDILKSAGANSGSLYHFFPTKQDLLIAVLEAYREGIGPMLIAPAWKGVNDPVERVFALLAAYRRMLIETDFFYGCPIGSLALEIHEPDPGVRELLAANFDGWVEAIEGCFREANLGPGVDRHALARLTLTVMEGGVMQSRTYRSIDAFDSGVAMLRDYVGRLRPTKSKARPRTKTIKGRSKTTKGRH